MGRPRLRNVPRGSLFSTEASKCLRVALLFSTKMPWDKSNYTRIIFSVEFKPEQLFQHDAFLDFLVFLWTFWPLLRIKETLDLILCIFRSLNNEKRSVPSSL